MSIRQRGKKWQVDVSVKGRRYRADVDSEREARILEADVRARLLVGKPIDTIAKGHIPNTLGALAQRTYDREWAGTLAEKQTWSNAQTAVSFFGANCSISGVLQILDEYVEYLEKKGLSNATINRKLAALSRMLRFAQSRGWLEHVPRIERKREGPGRTRYLSTEEEALLLQTLRLWGQSDYHDLVVVLIDTGMRVGEALRLERRDLDFAAARMGRPLSMCGSPRTACPAPCP